MFKLILQLLSDHEVLSLTELVISCRADRECSTSQVLSSVDYLVAVKKVKVLESEPYKLYVLTKEK